MEIYTEDKKSYFREGNITIEYEGEITDEIIQAMQTKLQQAIAIQSENDKKNFHNPFKPHMYTIRKWIRQYRNQLLKDSDFAMLQDAAVTNKAGWQTYRQQLRNLPKTWNLDDKPNIDLSNIYSFDDVATLPFPKLPE